jgi:hypothetical protein
MGNQQSKESRPKDYAKSACRALKASIDETEALHNRVVACRGASSPALITNLLAQSQAGREHMLQRNQEFGFLDRQQLQRLENSQDIQDLQEGAQHLGGLHTHYERMGQIPVRPSLVDLGPGGRFEGLPFEEVMAQLSLESERLSAMPVQFVPTEEQLRDPTFEGVAIEDIIAILTAEALDS